MSTMTNGIGWFEIGTDDPATTERFYGGLFGWTFKDHAGGAVPYRLVDTPAERSIKGGVFATGGKVPNYAVFCVVVDDVAATCAAAEADGGKVLAAPQNGADGMVYAYLLDPSGNSFAVYSPAEGEFA